jgi:transposase
VFVAGPSTSTRPELNLVERIWLYLKERYLSHRLYNDYEAIVDAACGAWNNLTAETGRITLLCTYAWPKQLVAATAKIWRGVCVCS